MIRPRNNGTIPWEAKVVYASQSMELTERQKAIIVGAILGDSSLEKEWRNPRLRFAHSINQKEYLLWKYQELRDISGNPVLIKQKYWKNGKIYESWQFSTRALPELLYYWNLFCPDRRKKIPMNISDILVHPLSLAVWLMDDGYKRNDCNAFRLNTDAFSFAEQRLLQSVLENNFGIQTKLHRKGKYWNIYISETSAFTFVDLVREYIIPSMRYKIALAPVTTGFLSNGRRKIASKFGAITR